MREKKAHSEFNKHVTRLRFSLRQNKRKKKEEAEKKKFHSGAIVCEKISFEIEAPIVLEIITSS